MPDIAVLESNVTREIQKEFGDITDWNTLSSLTVDEMKNFLSRYNINTRDDGNVIFNEFWKLCMEQYNEILKKTATELVHSTIKVKNDIIGEKTDEQKEKEIESKISQFESQMRKVSWDNINVYTLSGTEFFRKFFCGSLDPSTFGKKTFRDMFEHKGASDQCTLVEKNIPESTTDWNVCYICGNQIYDKYNPDRGIIRHRTRECEHVVCIFPGIGHKSIAQCLKDIEQADPDTRALIDGEYKQSHGCCNQTKLDELWIKLLIANGFFDVDDEALKGTLRKIFLNNKHDCLAVKKSFTQRTIQEFISQRSVAIKKQVLTPIVSLINKAKNNWGNLYELIFRIRQIAALRYNVHEIAVAYLTNANPPDRLKQLSIRLVEKKVIMMRLAHTLQPQNICKEVFNNFILYLGALSITQPQIVDFFNYIFGVKASKLNTIIGNFCAKIPLECLELEDAVIAAKKVICDQVESAFEQNSNQTEDSISQIYNYQHFVDGFNYVFKRYIFNMMNVKGEPDVQDESPKIVFNNILRRLTTDVVPLQHGGLTMYQRQDGVIVPTKSDIVPQGSKILDTQKIVKGERHQRIFDKSAQDRINKLMVQRKNLENKRQEYGMEVYSLYYEYKLMKDLLERIDGEIQSSMDKFTGYVGSINERIKTAQKQAEQEEKLHVDNKIQIIKSIEETYKNILIILNVTPSSDKSSIFTQYEQSMFTSLQINIGEIDKIVENPDSIIKHNIQQLNLQIQQQRERPEHLVYDIDIDIDMINELFDQLMMYKDSLISISMKIVTGKIGAENEASKGAFDALKTMIEQSQRASQGGSKRKVKSNKRSNKRSNMNRKTRKNRFSLLGKRTPSARMSNMRTNKTQSAKLKQRKNRTRR